MEAGAGRGFVGYKSAEGTKNYRRKPYDRDGVRHPPISIAAPLEAFVREHVARALDEPGEFLKVHRQAVELGQEKARPVEQLRLYRDLLTAIAAHRAGGRPGRYEPRPEKRGWDRHDWLTRPRAAVERTMAGRGAGK